MDRGQISSPVLSFRALHFNDCSNAEVREGNKKQKWLNLEKKGHFDLFCCFPVQVRVAFEEFSGHATQMLTRLEEMQETVSRKDFPQDLEGARRMIEEHATLKKKVIKAPIEELDTEGQR